MNFQHFPCLSKCDINHSDSVAALRAIRALKKYSFGKQHIYPSDLVSLLTLDRQAPGVLPDLGQARRVDPALQLGPRVPEVRGDQGGGDQEAAIRRTLQTESWHTEASAAGLTDLGLGVGQLLAIFPPRHSVIGSGAPDLLFTTDYWHLLLFIAAWPRTPAAGTRPPRGEHPCGESGLRAAALK